MQYEKLLSFMEEHTLFARKQITLLGVSGVDKYKEIWNTLADCLNKIGPVKKKYKEWEDVSTVYLIFQHTTYHRI